MLGRNTVCDRILRKPAGVKRHGWWQGGGSGMGSSLHVPRPQGSSHQPANPTTVSPYVNLSRHGELTPHRGGGATVDTSGDQSSPALPELGLQGSLAAGSCW